jgi:hypothetical protein
VKSDDLVGSSYQNLSFNINNTHGAPIKFQLNWGM